MNLILLGRADLTNADGSRIHLPTKKVLLLLAKLALEPGKSFERTVLGEMLWPKSYAEARRVSLRNALASLRKILGEEAIIATEDQIALKVGAVECDAIAVAEFAGDFMPGFDDDWVLDERLRIRLIAIDYALEKASDLQSEQRLEEAAKIIDAASKIDPLNQDVVERKVQLLEQMGKTTEATQATIQYQARVLRDLGLVCNIEPKTSLVPDQNPIISTGEWLIERNPEEAVSYLAATRSSWFAMDSNLALNFHERVLQASRTRSRSRDLVNAQRLYLMWVAGKFEESLTPTRQAFDEAISDQELEVAAILGNAVSFGSLSMGRFEEALRTARQVAKLADDRNDPGEIVRAQRHLAIIEQHSGRDSKWLHRIMEIQTLSDQLESAEEAAQQNLSMGSVNIRTGNLDMAATNISNAQRFFELNGWTRMVGYAMLGRAELLGAAGEHSEALQVLDDIRNLGNDAVGHSLAASLDDLSGQLYAKLSELDLAAESLARSTLLRRRLGSKPSVFESNLTNPTRQLLKEQLNEQDIRAAFSRAKSSQLSVKS